MGYTEIGGVDKNWTENKIAYLNKEKTKVDTGKIAVPGKDKSAKIAAAWIDAGWDVEIWMKPPAPPAKQIGHIAAIVKIVELRGNKVPDHAPA